MKVKFLIALLLVVITINFVSINSKFKINLNTVIATESDATTTDENQRVVDESYFKFEMVESGEKYGTLTEAMENVNDNTETTLKLLQDVTLDAQFRLEKTDNIILDLNGKTLTLMETKIGIYNLGNLKLVDTSVEQTGCIYQNPSTNYSYSAIYNSGILIIECPKIETACGIQNAYTTSSIIKIGSETSAPNISATKNRALSSGGKVEFYNGTTTGKYKNSINSTNYITPEGYNVKTVYENSMYTATLIKDETAPTFEIGWVEPMKFNIDDEIYIAVNINDDCELKYGQTANVLDEIVLKIDGKEVELKNENFVSVYYGNKYFELTLKGLSGDGEITLEIPENLIYDLAGNANVYTVLDTEAVVDNTPPENTTVQINDGDKETTSTTVKLNLEAIGAEEIWIKNGDYELPSFKVGDFKVTVPPGFAIADVNDDGTIKGIIEESEWNTISIRDIKRGLVIVELLEENGETVYGNEFVWIPCTLDGKNNTVKFGEKRYSVLDFSYYMQTTYVTAGNPYDYYNSFVYDGIDFIKEVFGESTYLTEKEFKNIVETQITDVDEKAILLAIFEEYVEEFNTNTNEEQEYIFESVEKYGGFYIGRYEMGEKVLPRDAIIDYSEYVVIQRDKDVFYTSDYLLLEEIAESLYPGMSRIVGTYSWDATILWLEQNGVNTLFTHEWYVDESDVASIESSAPLVEGVENRYTYTGSSEIDKALNIYDLAGNFPEWIDEYIYYYYQPKSLADTEQDVNTFSASASNYLKYGVVTPTLGDRVLDLYIREYYQIYNSQPSSVEESTTAMLAASYSPTARVALYVNEVPEWIPYESEIEFELSPELGEKTVEVYYKDDVGNIVGPITATITLKEEEVYTPSIIINDGDEETTTTTVTLGLDAKDAKEMWIKNSDYEIPNFEVDGIKVTVPVGFEIAKLDQSGDVVGILEETDWKTITKEDIQKGLVIVDTFEESGEVVYGNEFVWIPCTLDGKNDTVMFGEERYLITNFIIYLFNYGTVYDYTYDEYNSLVYTIMEQILPNMKTGMYLTHEELKQVFDNLITDEENKASMFAIIEEYVETFNTNTNEEQDEIFESVKKYGGFYIGRYELGKNVLPKTVSNDYSQYVVQKDKQVVSTAEYADLEEIAENLYPGLSRIAGTYSWDATILWLEQNGVNTFFTHEWYEDESEVAPTSANGIEVDGVENRYGYTGSSEEDKVLNIYDLAGNFPEWIDEYFYNIIQESSETDEAEATTFATTPSRFSWYAYVSPTFGERVLDLYNREYAEPYAPRPVSEISADESNVTRIQIAGYPTARVVLYIKEIPEWIPYTETMEFELTPELGEKTVQAYFKYEDGSIIGPVEDKITLVAEDKKVTASIYQNKKYTYDMSDTLTEITDAKLTVEPVNGNVTISLEENKLIYIPNSTFSGKENFAVNIENETENMKVQFEITVKRKPSGGGGNSGSSSNKKDEEKQENILYAQKDEFRGYTGDVISTTKDWNLLSNDSSSLKDVEIKIKEIVKKPENGTLYKDETLTEEGINEDGTFYYVPNKNFVGTDEFTYILTDGEKISEEASVMLVVKKYKLNIEDNGNHTWYIQGYTDGTVKVDNKISREEVAMIFYRLTVSEDKENFVVDNEFYSDVESNRWSSKAIAYLSEKGILKGYPDGTFKPTAFVTRAEFATIIERYLDVTGHSETKFEDLDESHWANEIIQLIASRGWMKGYLDNTFKPENNITRGEAMTTLNRMLMRKLTKVETKNKFSDLDENHWAYADVIEATASHSYEKDVDGNELWKITE